MKLWNKTKQLGFTLIELVIVIVILGILAAIAIPKYVDLSTTATDAAKLSMAGAVKSALAISIAENKTYPTSEELAANVQGGEADIVGGIRVMIDGTSYTVPTYNDTSCTTQTTATDQTVGCVDNIA